MGDRVIACFGGIVDEWVVEKLARGGWHGGCEGRDGRWGNSS